MSSTGAVPQEPVRLLSIDGGGIRGLSALLLLEQLMDASNEHRRKMNLIPLRPCEMFDMIGGTSTGGLIAIMLGRLKMSISDCKEAYLKFSEQAFTSKNLIAKARGKLSVGPRFETSPLEAAIKDLIGNDWQTKLLKDNDASACKVLEVMRVWEACRATSAALTFFEPIVVDGTTYSDGALLYNNPVQLVHGEASEMFEDREQMIVSLGTGTGNLDKFDPKLRNVAQLLGKLATETERTADDFYRREDAKAAKSGRYFRFSVPGMGDIGMHEHEKLNVVRLFTEGYLERAEVAQKAALCARVLARVPARIFPNNAASAPRHQSHWVVPFGRNNDFVGRDSEVDQLLDTVPPTKEKDNCQHTVIEGLGGIGKTQVAIETAFRIRDQHPDCSIFWVSAIDAVTFENAYRRIAHRLNAPGAEDNEVDVKSWLKATLSNSAWDWLLIIDNADDEKLFYDGFTSLSSFLPFSLRGSILFTTRNHNVAVRLDTPGIIDLGKLSRHHSIELLTKRLRDDQTAGDTDSLNTLLEDLADLPLAIKQASAYMAKTTITVRQYLSLCQSSDKQLIKLLSKNFGDRGRHDCAENPIAKTWLISFHQISRDNQLSIRYLAYMSFLSERDIPMSILPPVPSEVDAYEAIGTLQAYGFVTKQEGTGTDSVYTVHRLVHLVMRNLLEEQGKLQGLVTGAIRWQLKLLPQPDHGNRIVWMKYLPHTAKTLEFRSHSTDKSATVALLLRVSECYKTLGLYPNALWATKEALYMTAENSGSTELGTLLTDHKEAAKGDMRKESESLSRLVVGIMEKLRVKEQSSTPYSVSLLAKAYLRQGRLQDAMAMQQKALKLSEAANGPEDAVTRHIMSEFAVELSSLGNHEEAETIHRQALELQKKALGAEHPDTLRGIYNLALALLQREKYSEAELMLHDAVGLHKKVFGDGHPWTLQCMGKLGLALYKLERYEEAEPLLRKTVEVQRRVLGDEHPDLLVNMMNLALTLRALRKFEEAETMKQLVDSIAERLAP
ncbi:hypothetical protein BR93DRAFT_965075 [Coniochaeta sp. PMI_546]|nr:hypothetical protein BR93DRAFT_965075 [Coniochaeta sp. PMI_546]